MPQDNFNTLDTLKTRTGEYAYYRLDRLEARGYTQISRLPFSIRILLEGVLRNDNQKEVTNQNVLDLANWQPRGERPATPFLPGRVLMQDFSGLPVLVDLAAMRSALARFNGDPRAINPTVPVDLVIDHSVQVDVFGTPTALQRNAEIEFQRNRERYEFFHWGQKAFNNLRVVPPASGIVHQVNLEYLAQVVLTKEIEGARLAFPDTVVGTDSHTTMINGLGVVGWGVGGIEAVAAMLSQPIDILLPDVIGFRLTGKLPEGTTPTDLTLTITQILRQKGVVGKFVEFFGPGLAALPLTDRAMIANMSPENGATITYFPVDQQTLDYLRMTGRPEELVERVAAYYQAQHLFRDSATPDPGYTDTIELDLGSIEPSLAGPKRPQDRVPLRQMKAAFQQALLKPKNEGGYGLTPDDLARSASVKLNGKVSELKQGAVLIAAITSCTNTSNPFVMIAAGLLARKAVEKGLKVEPYVKTSLSPGSRVVTEYLQQAGLLEPLAQLGFYLAGYGCMTCIGNSGPLAEEVVQAVNTANLTVAAVLSGNRNFEGRVHSQVQANYLASPPLVVAYALAGNVNVDLNNEPIGIGADQQPVYLREIWPSNPEVLEAVQRVISPEMFKAKYADLFNSNFIWNQIHSEDTPLYPWRTESTYVQEPPFFTDLGGEPAPVKDIHGAYALAVLGDSITTDHISPAGAIAPSSAAGKYLLELGVPVSEFNSYGSRRGNDRVLTRGTFANIRLKNQLVPGVEGSFTLHLPDGEKMSIYDAAMKYKAEGVPLVVLAGKEYGTGSSRDWAAKGALLLGVKAIIAESFERIHRSNLVGMGVLPLQFKAGENIQSLGLSGKEQFSIEGIQGEIEPRCELTVQAVRSDGSRIQFQVMARLDTPLEVEYYRNGGILQTVLYNLLRH